jgi:hypothetical protein
MRAYCPCEKRCKGYSGAPRRCDRIGNPSGIMPQEFISQSMDQTEGTFSKLLVGGLGIFGGALAEKVGGKVVYQVWKCPACKCRVLTQFVKNADGTDENEVAAIKQCR